MGLPAFKAGENANVTSPIYYQWQLNGTSIPGATGASFPLTDILYSQCGSYSVVVSNLMGVVTNYIAEVYVNAPLTLALDMNAHPPNFRISGSAPQTMVLQLSTNLSSTVWTPLFTNTKPLLPINYLDAASINRELGFYRLESPP